MRYAVIVKKHILEPASKPALSASLSAVLGARQEQILTMLDRGPLTIEADLSRAEARALCERLIKRSIPAQIFDELGTEDLDVGSSLVTSSPPIASPAKTPPKVSLFEDDEILEALEGLDFGASAPVDASTAPPSQDEPAPVQTNAWGQVLGGWSAPSVEPAPAPAPREVERPATSNSGGWASLGFGGSAPLEERDAPAPTPQPKPSLNPTPPAVSPSAPLGFGAEPVIASKPPTSPQPQTPPSPKPVTPVAPPVEVRRPDRFDGGAITDAFAGPDEGARPPYVPQGYDGRPPHSAEIAFGLSVLAPGAGQVYNGDAEKALSFGAWFFLVMPWIKSAKEARARAERIATYYAPRPADGSLGKALRYAGIWYLCVILTLSFFGWGISELIERMSPKQEVKVVPLVVVADGVKNATFHVKKAVEASWASLDDAEAEWREAQMSDEERAERLFLISLPECKMNSFVVCASSMKRVTQLNARHPYAFKIQVWAQLRQRTAEALPMPEVQGYQSILDYENKVDLGQQPSPSPSDMGEDVADLLDAGDLGRPSLAPNDQD